MDNTPSRGRWVVWFVVRQEWRGGRRQRRARESGNRVPTCASEGGFLSVRHVNYYTCIPRKVSYSRLCHLKVKITLISSIHPEFTWIPTFCNYPKITNKEKYCIKAMKHFRLMSSITSQTRDCQYSKGGSKYSITNK